MISSIINLGKMPTMKCSSCGSSNTEMLTLEQYKLKTNADDSFIKKLSKNILSLFTIDMTRIGMPMGKYMIICKDCGKEGMIMCN